MRKFLILQSVLIGLVPISLVGDHRAGADSLSDITNLVPDGNSGKEILKTVWILSMKSDRRFADAIYL